MKLLLGQLLLIIRNNRAVNPFYILLRVIVKFYFERFECCALQCVSHLFLQFGTRMLDSTPALFCLDVARFHKTFVQIYCLIIIFLAIKHQLYESGKEWM